MKRFIFIIFLAIVNLNVNAQAVYIPDVNFRNYCLTNPFINTNQDGEISMEEAQSFDGTIDVSFKNISSLQGIEYFINLKMLNCSNNFLTSLNLTNNTKLEWLVCDNNQITNLQLGTVYYLTYLSCSNNPLTNGVFEHPIPMSIKKLYVNNTNIEHIWASGHLFLEEVYFYNCPNLKTLEIDGCQELKIVNGSETQITDSIDFSNLENLQEVRIFGLKTTGIRFNNNINLQTVYLSNNTFGTESINFQNCPKLSIINIHYFTILESVNVSQCPMLTELEITSCLLSSLDVSNNLMLQKLDISENNVSNTLDISQNAMLEELYCENNNLKKIKLNTSLKKLVCFTNPLLESLEGFTACTSLEFLNAHVCKLTGTLDLRNNFNITDIIVSENYITNLLLNIHPNLTYLACDSNHISVLNLKDCPNLSILYCNNNDLAQLNLSKCNNLTELNCSFNNIEQLNVSNLTSLEVLNCRNNNLNFFRIRNGNEQNITSFNARYNPNLLCIEVSNANLNWAIANWSAYIDNQTSFNDSCAIINQKVEISLIRDTTIINHNDTVFIGEVFIGDTLAPVRFDIENLGNSILYLTGHPPVTLTGNNVSNFLCDYLQTDINIEPSEYTSFYITFTPDSVGNKYTQVVIPNNDGDEDPFVFTIIGKGVQHLVNDTALTIGADANSTVSFNITSDRNWTVTSDKPWLIPSQNSGNGNAMITLTAQENPTNITRTATITVSASPTLTQTINVTQLGAVVSLNLSDTLLLFSALNGSTKTFNISVNRSWTISSSQPWLNISPSNGNAGNHLIIVTASENTASVSRTAEIFVSCLNVTKTLSVIQSEGVGISNEDYVLYGQRIDGTNADDNLGTSVSINSQGDIIAVGIPLNDDNGSNSGKIKVFQLSPSKSVSWTQIGQDIQGITGSKTGWTVSLNGNGNIVAIGSPYENYNEGRVRVYQYQNNQWIQMGQTITNQTPYTGHAGYSIDLNETGTVLAVGEFLGQNPQGTTTGLVSVYEFKDTAWVQKGSTIYGNQASSYFGWSVNINSDGTKVIVGSKNESSSKGAARVYKFENNQWVQMGQTIVGQASFDYSGTSVSINYDGSIIAIGTPQNDGNGLNSGVTRIYRFNNNNWVQMGSDIYGEASDDYAGYSVSLNYWGSVISIGAYRNSQTNSRAGQVRIYQFKNNTWTQIGQDIDGEAYYDYFGNSVSINKDGTRFIAGAYQADFGGSNSGSAYVFKKNITNYMNVTPDTLNFLQCNVLIDTITVVSNASWNITSNKPWITLSQTNGNGSSYIIVYLSENHADTIRTAELTFTSGIIVKKIVINQIGLPKVDLYYTACDNFNFNGQTYTQSGVYSDTISNVNSCDSIIILHLNIKNSSVNDTIVTVCNSYTWNGTTYTESGTYTKVIQNIAGCDSIITLNLTINNSTTSTINQTACDSYTLNGQTYTSSGTYMQTLTNAAGCDSVITLNLTIKNSTTSVFDETVCDSYTLNGQTYTSSGTYTQTLTNAAGCDSIITLNLTINNSTTSTINQTACDSYTLNGQIYTSSGTYTQTLTNAAGCDSVITLNLIINNSTTSTLYQIACDSYTWNGTTYTESGTYTKVISNTAGCDSTITLNLTIHKSTSNILNIIDCTPITINGQTYATTGTYTQTLVNAAGCDSILTINFTLISGDTTITVTACDSYTYNGVTYTESGIYVQNIPNCSGQITINLTVNHSTVATINVAACESYSLNGQIYNESGTYYQNLNNSMGCDSLIIINLTIGEPFNHTDYASICEGEIFTWHGNQYSSTGTYTVTYTTNAGCDSIYTLNLTVKPKHENEVYVQLCSGSSYYAGGGWQTTDGIYTDTYTNEYGCDSVIVTHLTFHSIVISNVSASICEGTYYVLPGGNVVWNTGTYYDTLTSLYGCDSIIITNLTVQNLPNAGISVNDTVCNYESFVNLFSLLGGTPDENGTWSDDDNSGAMNNGIFDASQVAPLSTYNFTYTVSGNGICEDATATVSIYVDECTGILNLETIEVNIYPNPTRKFLRVEFDKIQYNTEISMMDIAGQVISKTVLKNEDKYVVDLSNQPKGIYVIRIILNEKIIAKRIILQ